MKPAKNWYHRSLYKQTVEVFDELNEYNWNIFVEKLISDLFC